VLKISGEFDNEDGGEQGADYKRNEIDPEKEFETSNENDPEYEPFESPDFENSNPEYDPFKAPDFDHEEENDTTISNLELGDTQDKKSAENFKDIEPESENEAHSEGIINPSNSNTVTVLDSEQPEQELDQIPGDEPEHEEIQEEMEWITPEGVPQKPGESPEVMEIRAELEEMGLVENTEPFYRHDESPEYDSDSNLERESEQYQEPKSELEAEEEFEKRLEQEEREILSDNDKILETEEEVYQDSRIEENFEKLETQEEFKETSKEPNLENPQEEKEKIQDTENDNFSDLKEQYHQETGRRAIYAGKKTKGFLEWKEIQEEKEYKVDEENQELDIELKKEFHELKEESVEYLINRSKDVANNEEFSEKTRRDLIELLKKYDKIRNLHQKLQNREITKQEFEQERVKVENELSENLRIGKLLFKDFEAYRRDYNETMKRAGKRVAMLQISHKTNRFLLNISQKLELLKKEGISHDSLEKSRIYQEWAKFLKNHIEESTYQEISKETKEELQHLINQFTNNNGLLIEQLRKQDPRFDNFFKELKSSLLIFKEYKKRKYEKNLVLEGKRVVKKLSLQLVDIKKDYALQQIFNDTNPDFQILKDILRENLYNYTTLNLKGKSAIIKIIQKDKLSEEDKTKLVTALSKLQTKDLASLFEEDFKKHTQNLLKLSFDFDLFKEFLHHVHRNQLIKQFITEFNTSGNWIKNFRPTKTFINFLKEKQEQLKVFSKDGKTNTKKDPLKVLQNFSSLMTKIRDKDIITKVIKALISENPGKYNAYDIEKWLLITEVSARNQLKRIFAEDEYQIYVRTQKHVTIETIGKIAENKGGKCHTKTLKNAKVKLHLECAEGHHFFTTYDSVVYHRTWCPECHIYLSETICRRFFEKIFKRPFPKSYPEWLTNENGNQMELDGNNKDLRLAFEYQGIQHRKKAFGMNDDDLIKLQKEDALKLKKCEENYVTLLQIPDEEIVPYNEMQDYIIKEYEKKTGKTLENVPNYKYQDFDIYENKYAKKFRAYVENKGGSLMSPYFSARKEVTLMCEKGHHWITTPDSVYKDNWCSICARNMKGTTEYFRKIGIEFNCNLINEYINAKTLLRYKCPRGHKFEKSPYWLKKDYKKIEILCPECKLDQYAKKFQDFIRKKEGHLLTPYKGRFKPIKIKCKDNHVWDTTPAAVYQGSWCKICADENHPNKERQQTAKKELVQMIESLNYHLLSEYQNNTKKIQIVCQKQHQFTITPKYFKRLVNQNIEPCRECRKGT
jgi:hypothetical protein